MPQVEASKQVMGRVLELVILKAVQGAHMVVLVGQEVIQIIQD